MYIRVIHKSVKHFKNSQQIDYATDHGNSYADKERNTPSFFLHISQMFNVSTFGNTADIYAIVHLVPHACQHITVDQSHSSGDTVANILEISGEWRHKDSVLHKPPEKKWHGVKSGDRGGHRIKPLNPELNPICYLLALLAQHFFHVSRIMVKSSTLRLLMSYIYIYEAYIYIYIYEAPILDVFRSHTTTHHSR